MYKSAVAVEALVKRRSEIFNAAPVLPALSVVVGHRVRKLIGELPQNEKVYCFFVGLGKLETRKKLRKVENLRGKCCAKKFPEEKDKNSSVVDKQCQ